MSSRYSAQAGFQNHLEQFKSCLITFIISQISKIKELKPPAEKEIQDTIMSSMKRNSSMQDSCLNFRNETERKKISVLELKLSKLQKIQKEGRLYEKEFLNKLKLKDIKIHNLSNMVNDLKAKLNKAERNYKPKDEDQEGGRIKRHTPRRGITYCALQDRNLPRLRVTKRSITILKLEREKDELTQSLETCQYDNKIHLETIDKLKNDLKKLEKVNKKYLIEEEDRKKEITAYKLHENMLKAQLSELNKEKKLWESSKSLDYDQVSMKATLSDPFFKVGGDHVSYIEHSLQSKSFMLELGGQGSLKKAQKVKIHQTTKNLNLALVNGALVESFKKEIYPNPKNSTNVGKHVKNKRGSAGQSNYGFPRMIDEGAESVTDGPESKQPSISDEAMVDTDNDIAVDRAKEIEEMVKNKYSVFNALSINLEELSIARPRYFTLIEHHISSGEAFKNLYEEMDEKTRSPFDVEKQTLLRKYKEGKLELTYNPPFVQWLFVTIRALFDSKMYEHFMKIGDPQIITPFPEFVYSWLGTFCVDNITRKVRLLEFYELDHVDEIRLQILLGLKTNLEPKMWEYSIFLDFLEEKHTVDELHFYLLCRNYLFGGPQLTDRKAQFERVHLISLEVTFSNL
ncbi:unnamed protein product [Moneuplotes crassus]|uniref:Uncharacterized protein n=1 Tax=Euplotes crassus TaxID=5936 RepID=A0AAD1X9S5_EUPCR|nr:unnamed protein product [Moneuplotes crassus]